MVVIGLYAQLACIWEATARKPGNVHRYRDFDDATYLDFLTSAAAIGPVMAEAASLGIGPAVHWAVRLTQTVVPHNTNLGIILLLAPLAAVSPHRELREGLPAVLAAADVTHSAEVFAAIRLAKPSGLGRVEEQDIAGEPTLPLRQVMALAADRDLVARQYANGYREVFDEGVPMLLEMLQRGAALETAVVGCHLHLMATHPDTLIARKRGRVEAEESARRARRVLDAGWPARPEEHAALRELDGWLRAEGHSRNPGTTADLVTACLFVALRTGIITLPLAVPWAAPFDLP
ncbi:MAG: triphosphoribosyl-dephospho-CoA synthase [Gemmataceae bacterium]|nr:triphosphoribosyl-dephospho-CoA synthase [Gemmataceae bacterium]